MASTEMPESSSKMSTSASVSEKEKMKIMGQQRLAAFKKKREAKNKSGGKNKSSSNNLSDRENLSNGSETNTTDGGKIKQEDLNSSHGLVGKLDDGHSSMQNLKDSESEDSVNCLNDQRKLSTSDVSGNSTYALDRGSQKRSEKEDIRLHNHLPERNALTSDVHQATLVPDGPTVTISSGAVSDVFSRISSNKSDVSSRAMWHQNDTLHSKDAKTVNGNSLRNVTDAAMSGPQFRIDSNSNGIKNHLLEPPNFTKQLPSIPGPQYRSTFKPSFLGSIPGSAFKPEPPSESGSGSLFKPIQSSLPETGPGSQRDSFMPSFERKSSPLLENDQVQHKISVNKIVENPAQTRNDDFAALEQHIDDLTQEKFSLQRALDAAKSLAETLSQQNSALAEDFNSQAAIINQLQSELEKKKEEISAQSLVVDRFMKERERVQQENNAAVERSQMLAAEVISLEEKMLKLRSSELKLQRELESLKSENDSYRGQLSALDKDRQNLKSMLEMLQEDKKLLQTQLQKKLVDGASKPNAVQKESRHVSTSTDDLVSDEKRDEAISMPIEARIRPHLLDASNNIASILASGPSSQSMDFNSLVKLSSDDIRVVDSIDSVITELFSEKESLLESLRRESTRASELQALNIELSKKLEVQTQRLELAVAQSMALGGGGGGGTPLNHNEDEIEDSYFVDEGDEVVERVLGWIMRLFPGGSSTRRTSKRL